MAREKIVHTGSGVELVRRLASDGERIFTSARARELAPSVGLSEGYVRQALHHLAKSGWVIRLRKGLYALSSTVPGVTPAHEFEIAMALVEPAAISHCSALHYHGLTEQAPRKVFVLTTTEASVPRDRGAKAEHAHDGFPVAGTSYRFVEVKPERFFGTDKVWVGEVRVTITGPERTLLDGLSMPQYCGDSGEVLHAFEARAGDLNFQRIIEYALKLDAATAKRLGWVLEHQGVDVSKLEELVALPIKGYRKLDPTGPRKGPTNRRWMIHENLPGRVRACSRFTHDSKMPADVSASRGRFLSATISSPGFWPASGEWDRSGTRSSSRAARRSESATWAATTASPRISIFPVWRAFPPAS